MPCWAAGRSGATRRPAGVPRTPASRRPTPSASPAPGGPTRRPPRPKEAAMAVIAPDTTRTSGGWLDAFLADWQPGTGEPRETREPATGRPLITLAQSTPDDVARAAAAAAEAQPAWAAMNYAERAA